MKDLQLESLLANPTDSRPPDLLSTYWKDYMSHLPWEELENLVGGKVVVVTRPHLTIRKGMV